MKSQLTILLILLVIINIRVIGQGLRVESPNRQVVFTINTDDALTYSVKFKDRTIIEASPLGFELEGETRLSSGFEVLKGNMEEINRSWVPVVKSKHARVVDRCSQLHLQLKERSGGERELELTVRAYNDGIAFRYHLPRADKTGNREITRELTGFYIPGDPKAWVVEYGGYATSNESEFFERKVSYLKDSTIAGMPFLMDYGNNCWVAITEANIDNYAAFYIGTDGTDNHLTTKLVPYPGEPENGVKVRSKDDIVTPWRVIMIGDSPGDLIESDIIQNLNEPCAIEDPSWIKPGISAWDHWWSGEVKMEMPVIKQYIDLAAEMGWEYMLVDWQWYGPFNTPEADITRWAPQINMPEIIEYAHSKNVGILIWLYSSDVDRNQAYKKAFPLYKEWGISGVKIDFMDRDDQEMVNWYQEIIKTAADNELLVDFHGAYKPDGIIRTYPNMITREGVMGNEYYKFSYRMNPEHNVKLAFTRMLAGAMDYTPGGFLNVTKAEFKNQTPALVWNTRAAELAKFVVYESPLTVVCDHPDNILGAQGSEFLKIVPTVWDNTKFLGGYPGDHVAIARQNGEEWYLGILNNSQPKSVDVNLDFLDEGNYVMEYWSDSKKSGTAPSEVTNKKRTVTKAELLSIDLAENGGYAAVLRKK